MIDLQKTMGTVIRQARRTRQMTLRQLAEHAALSVVYLGEVERGKKYPSARVLEQLAEALGLSVADLLEDVAIALRGDQQILPAATGTIGFARPAVPNNGPRMALDGGMSTLRPFEVAIMGALFTVPQPRKLGA